MKRIAIFSLLVILVFVLAGCSNSNNVVDDKKTNTDTNENVNTNTQEANSQETTADPMNIDVIENNDINTSDLDDVDEDLAILDEY